MSKRSNSQLIEENGFKIFIMSWNTESTRLCETVDPKIKEHNRSAGFLGIKNLEGWYDGDIADFFNALSCEIINADSPELVVIGFQEDAFPGSYFHSHMLKTEMPKIGYGLVKRTNLKGVGVTTFKAALNNWDLMARGLRISIYAKKDLMKDIESSEIDLRSSIGCDGQLHHLCDTNINQITRGKGAVVSYIIYPGIGKFAFICTHLPFNAKSLIDTIEKNDPMIRQDSLNQVNTCYNNILRDFVKNQYPEPDYVFFFGDFNYRVQHPNRASFFANAILENPNNINMYNEIYLKYDEMHQQMVIGTIYAMNEGVDNKGPMFAPTCKMSKNRKSKNYDENNPINNHLSSDYRYIIGKHNQRVPSWCDRIIYSDYTCKQPYEIQCIKYDRFDYGDIMVKSDHAAVIGIYKLQLKGKTELNNIFIGSIPLNIK